jgi:hypothetical protein
LALVAFHRPEWWIAGSVTLYSDRVHSAVGDEALERPSAVRPRSRARRAWDAAGDTWRSLQVDLRLIVAFLLIAGGVGWACIRGLHLYGVNPAYDADQPPLLLVFAGLWLLYRSRRR